MLPYPVWSPSSHCNTHHRRKYFLGEKYLLAAADRVTGGPRGRCLLTIKMRYRHWSGTSDSAAQWRPSPVSIYPVRQWQVTLDFLLFSHILSCHGGFAATGRTSIKLCLFCNNRWTRMDWIGNIKSRQMTLFVVNLSFMFEKVEF